MSNTVSKGVHLSIQALHKQFGGIPVLQGLDLEVKAGEFVAIVGRSGCGKSTLLRLVAGLDAPNQGGILLDGETLRQLNRSTRVMFQDARLLPWQKVYKNIGLGLPKDALPKIRWALHQVGLTEKAKEYPSRLSGGQRQRVALARALVSEPRLLLLDEPLGALDAFTRLEMQQLIENLWQEQQFTSILITHDVDEAVALADRVVLMESGKITMDVAISLPRPRSRSHSIFIETVETIRSRVMQHDRANSVNLAIAS